MSDGDDTPHDPNDHAAVLADFFADWHARFGSSTTSPTTTNVDEDDEREADERERGEGVEVEQVVAYLDEVVAAGERQNGDE